MVGRYVGISEKEKSIPRRLNPNNIQNLFTQLNKNRDEKRAAIPAIVFT